MSEEAASARALLGEIADKWTIAVLEAICDSGGCARFNVIKRQTHPITQKTLTQCLRRLERSGILERRILQTTTPIGVEYAITDLGRSLDEPFRAISLWARENLEQVQSAQRAFDGCTG